MRLNLKFDNFALQPTYKLYHYSISGNVIADRKSRHFQTHDTERKLDSELLQSGLAVLNLKPDVAQLASRQNR